MMMTSMFTTRPVLYFVTAKKKKNNRSQWKRTVDGHHPAYVYHAQVDALVREIHIKFIERENKGEAQMDERVLIQGMMFASLRLVKNHLRHAGVECLTRTFFLNKIKKS